MIARLFLLCTFALISLGCATLQDEMRRAEDNYEQARYEESLVWLEDLESEIPDMDADMRARFHYLRGMAAYRLEQRADALHYLAIARELAGDEAVGVLRPEWRQTMERTLAELIPEDASHTARPSPSR